MEQHQLNSKLVKCFEQYRKKPQSKSRRKALFQTLNAWSNTFIAKEDGCLESWAEKLFPNKGAYGILEMFSLIIKNIDFNRQKHFETFGHTMGILQFYAVSSIDFRLKMIESGTLEVVVALLKKAYAESEGVLRPPSAMLALFTGSHLKRRMRELPFYEDFCEVLRSSRDDEDDFQATEEIEQSHPCSKAISCRTCGKLEEEGGK